MNPGSLSILFNCTTNIVGGGVKNSALFIEQAINDPEVRWTFAISPQVGELLKKRGVDVFAHCFEQSPARSRSARDKLRRLVWDEKPDCVYTMAGPAYVKFNVPHIMGLSNPYVTHAGYKHMVIGTCGRKRVIQPISTLYKFVNSLNADAWVFQTTSSRDAFRRRAKVPLSKCYMLPNAFDAMLNDSCGNIRSKHDGGADDNINIFCPMGPYWHKGAHFLPRLALSIKECSPSPSFRFIVSLPFDSPQWQLTLRRSQRLGVSHMIENIGQYSYADLPKLLDNTSAFFVPSVLETFSASYLEAFLFGKPLIACEAPFMRSVCHDAVLAIHPNRHKETAKKIIDLLGDHTRCHDLISRGRRVLFHQINHHQRYAMMKKNLSAFMGSLSSHFGQS